MYSPAELYRLRGSVAQQWAAQAIEETTKKVFQDIAAGWFMLAELMDCLNEHEEQADKN